MRRKDSGSSNRPRLRRFFALTLIFARNDLTLIFARNDLTLIFARNDLTLIFARNDCCAC